jgi:hypothetical protein
MSDWGYVITAYLLTWAVVGGLVVYVELSVVRSRAALAAALREGDA